MFFTESEHIAEQHPDLARVLKVLDAQLGQLGPADVIRPADLASFLRTDPNQVRSALEMFTEVGVLSRAEMIECSYCQMAAPQSDYQDALDDEDEYRCTSCDRPLTDRTIRIITAYQRGEKWPEDSNPTGDSDLREGTSKVLHDEVGRAKEACIFRKGTKVWTLCFAGTTAHVADLAGMNYIAELLRRPRTPIDADALVGTIRENADVSVEAAEQPVVMAGAAMAGIPLTDAKAIKAVKTELAKKKGELTDCADDATNAQLRREISQLQNYLTKVKGQHGRPRTTGGLTSRARSRVKHAIDRAITKIAEQHLPLANHLQDSIRTGNSLVYTPTDVPDWQF